MRSLKEIFNFKKGADNTPPPVPPKAALYSEVATDQLVQMLSHYPDVDEVLKQAGIRRDKLRLLLTDDEIAQACETRLDALLATPVRFEPSEGKDKEFLDENFMPFVNQLITGGFQARLFGYSVTEAVYRKLPNGRILYDYLGEKPFEWFEPTSDGRLLYHPLNGSAGVNGIEVDQNYKFFLARVRPTYRQPYGEPLLSKLYWPWFFRTNGWKFWAKFLERFGAPLLVGKSSDPVAMRDALLMAHTQAVIGIDVNDDVTTVGSNASGSAGAAFDAFETATIRRIQKVILGQTLTSGTDGGSGNRALGNVHGAVRMDKRNSDIKLIQPLIQKACDAFCYLNGIKRHKVVFGDEQGLESDRAKRDTDLFKTGVRFTPEYYQDNYGLREDDFTVAKDPPPPDPNSTDGGPNAIADPNKPAVEDKSPSAQ